MELHCKYIYFCSYVWSLNSHGGPRCHQPPFSPKVKGRRRKTEELLALSFVINIIQTGEEIKWPEGQAGQQTPRCTRLSISDSASFSHSSLKLPASDNSADYHRKVLMHFSRHATDLNISFTGHFHHVTWGCLMSAPVEVSVGRGKKYSNPSKKKKKWKKCCVVEKTVST